MNLVEAKELSERVRPVLEPVWRNNTNVLHGQGARLGEDGKPEIFVYGTEHVSGIPEEFDGIRIVFEIRPMAELL